MVAMQHENLHVEIDGNETKDIYGDLVSLEVELDEDLAGMFRLSLAMLLRADGTWRHLDDRRLVLWKPVVVTAGPAGACRQLITGYITQVRPDFGGGLACCRLDIWGMDATVLMDRKQQIRDWPNKSDSDIATETFHSYGLTPNVTDTGIVHDERVSTIIQRESDIQLLRRLAARNGYECFVDGGTGYFRRPAVDAAPQPVLAVQSGNGRNVNRFWLQVDALTPANVTMSATAPVTGEVLTETADGSDQPTLGANTADSYLGPGMPSGLVQAGHVVTTGSQEMAALCQGLYDRNSWFVTGGGEVDGYRYGSVLMPRRTVTIEGIGKTYSGDYYVTHVTHRFTKDGYTQIFRVKRNALMPTGNEKFSARAGGPLGGAP